MGAVDRTMSEAILIMIPNTIQVDSARTLPGTVKK